MTKLFSPLAYETLNSKSHRGLADVRVLRGGRASAAVHLVHLEAVPWGVQPGVHRGDGSRGARADLARGRWNLPRFTCCSWRPIAQFIRSQSAVAGMQLAHAGRKGSTSAPCWEAIK